MESFDSVKKSYPGAMQKNMLPEKQEGIQYTMSNYPAPYLDAHSIHRPDVRMHQISGQTNPTHSMAPSQTPHISPAGLRRNASSNALKLGEVSLIGALPAIPARGTTDLRNDLKGPVKAAQLTIFYNGSVCVYDDISPEKAQAIMLLAGNGPSSVPSNAAVPTAPVQSPALMSPVIDGLIPNRAHSLRPSSPIQLPFRATFHSLLVLVLSLQKDLVTASILLP